MLDRSASVRETVVDDDDEEEVDVDSQMRPPPANALENSWVHDQSGRSDDAQGDPNALYSSLVSFGVP